MSPQQETQPAAADILTAAYHILGRWETENLSLDDLLDDMRDELSPRIRSGVTSLMMTFFRFRGAAEAMLGALEMKLKARFSRYVLLAIVQLHFQSGLPPHAVVNMAVTYAVRRFGKSPGGLINAALRKAALLNPADFPNQLPSVLLNRWLKYYGKETVDVLTAELQNQPAFTCRLCGAFENFPDTVGACPVQADFLPENLFFTIQHIRAFFESGLLKTNRVYIQDPSTFLPFFLMRECGIQNVGCALDVCAAPGGKTLLLAEYIKPSEIIAADRSAQRQERTRENITRFAQCFPETKIEVIVTDALSSPDKRYDLVLLDVPCSNTGVLKRRPDAGWRFAQTKMSELTILQKNILEIQSESVLPGGYLIYSTCSIEPEENAFQIKQFCERHPEFKCLTERQLLPSAQHDGGFAAILQRSSDS